MHPVEELQAKIEKSLAALNVGDHPATLYEPARYMLSLGGKRMRPLLVLMACEMAGGNYADAMQAALGFELFHNFTLLHDDIMDKAPLRRGKQTVHEKWNIPTAILSGDAMLVKSVQLIQKCGNPKITDVFLSNALLVCEGQQLDMDFENRDDVSIDEYLRMITLKTAVLPGACMQVGALMAGADDQTALCFFEAGKNLGIAFQLKDDFLDAYGKKQFGKQTGGDILANKKTFLYLRSLQLLDKSKADKLKALYHSDSNGNHKVEEVKAFFNSVNITAEIQKEMDFYYRQSLQYLNSVPVDEDRKKPLKTLFEKLIQRET
jgi:geranylgeranyl diphosphate synthase type II